jgi:hypothetical protein
VVVAESGHSAMGLGGVFESQHLRLDCESLSFHASFPGLAAIDGLLYQFRMPETRPQKSAARAREVPNLSERMFKRLALRRK